LQGLKPNIDSIGFFGLTEVMPYKETEWELLMVASSTPTHRAKTPNEWGTVSSSRVGIEGGGLITKPLKLANE
jgi:hypothetical protein